MPPRHWRGGGENQAHGVSPLLAAERERACEDREAGMISLRPGRREMPSGGRVESELPEDRPPAPLVTLANRLPVAKTRNGWRTADGGLVAALRPTLETRPASWVGWDGGAPDVPHTLPELAAR